MNVKQNGSPALRDLGDHDNDICIRYICRHRHMNGLDGLSQCPDCGEILLGIKGRVFNSLQEAWHVLTVEQQPYFSYGTSIAKNVDELFALINSITTEKNHA